jgi:hypothetical protein
MADWLKTLTEKLKKPSEEITLRDRLEAEQRRQREESQRTNSGLTVAQEQAIQKEDLKALTTLLAWKLDVRKDNILANPAKVDGLWFGVSRYLRAGEGDNADSVISWKLYLYRPCPNCKHLLQNIPLGDQAEITSAVEHNIRGEEVPVSKSTARLAAHLADIDAHKADPYCPRFCPHCRKPIRGGTQ